jgi:pimeloyl-ACP methyl ester carboxylesterase
MKIIVGKNEWNITVLGNGNNILLAFHGYGQNHLVFEHFAELMCESHSIWCLDLAFHGENTAINQDFQFDKQYAEDLINTILLSSGKSQVGLLGYSIGGRIALSVASLVPDKISEIYLFAPDGLPVSKAYFFLTHTWLGKALFQRFVNSAGFAIFLVKLGKEIKLLSSKLAGYYLFEIATLEKRRQLFLTWISYKQALPNKKNLSNWNKNGEVTCVLGMHDGIIPLKKTQKRLKETFPDSRVIVLEAGHNLLSEKAIKKLAGYF